VGIHPVFSSGFSTAAVDKIGGDVMLLAVIAMILGIVIENVRWPLDRSAMRQRLQECTGREQVLVMVSHSLVRWLIAFTVAGLAVAGALQMPILFAVVEQAVHNKTIPIQLVDVLVGLTVGALTWAIALTARWIAR
jgi:hypothetical protein